MSAFSLLAISFLGSHLLRGVNGQSGLTACFAVCPDGKRVAPYGDLIPRARENKSHLFTRVKAEREQHLVRQRAYSAAQGQSPALPPRQALAHSALHTLDFIEQHYVRDNENSVHILWTHILLHTREPLSGII